MSLKAFHVLFVTIAVILAVGFGVWAVYDYKRSGETASLAWGVMSILTAFGLVVYGRWFLQKLRHMGG